MRRMATAVIAILTISSVLLPAVSMPAAQAGGPTITFAGRTLHREWVTWAAGSNTNPLVDPTFCGEIVGGRFLLNLALAAEATYECGIPSGVTVVAAGGYALALKPLDARTDRGLRKVVNESLEGFGPSHGRLDGEPVDLAPALGKTGVYSIAVGESSLIQTVDPDFPDDRRRTEVAAGAWIFQISGLSVGDHRLIIRQRVFGSSARAVFILTIT